MADVKKISHKGKDIFYCDNKGLQGDDVIDNYQKIMRMIKGSGQTDVLTLTDMNDVVISDDINKKMKEFGNEIKKLTKKGAVLGMAKGSKKILINLFTKISGMNLKLFDNIDEAKEWLVS